MKTYFVTVQAPDGFTWLNRLMVQCETEKQARRAAKRAFVESGIVILDPGITRQVLDSLTITVEEK